MSSSGDRTHNQSVLQSHFVPLRRDWPQYTYMFYNNLNYLTAQHENSVWFNFK